MHQYISLCPTCPMSTHPQYHVSTCLLDCRNFACRLPVLFRVSRYSTIFDSLVEWARNLDTFRVSRDMPALRNNNPREKKKRANDRLNSIGETRTILLLLLLNFGCVSILTGTVEITGIRPNFDGTTRVAQST